MRGVNAKERRNYGMGENMENADKAILIVDDDVSVKETTARSISLFGYNCVGAESVEEAKAILAETTFDVILSDYMMPGNKEGEFLQYLCDNHPDTPVIVLTGYANMDSAITSLRSKVYDYLFKPISIALLMKKVNQAVDQSRMRRGAVESEKKYRFLAEKYQALFNNVIDPLLVYSTAGGKLIEFNSAALEFYEYTAEEMSGKTIFDLTIPEQRGEIREIVNKCIEKGTCQALDCVHLTKSGAKIPVEVHSSCEEANGSLQVVATVRDVSERERSMIELLQVADSAREANRAKNEFLANMSHELRTPLNSVIGLSELLLKDVYGETNEKQRELLGGVLESGEHLLQLINDLLDLAKIEAEQLTLNPNRIDVDLLCRTIAWFVKSFAEKKNIDIEMSVPTPVDSIVADELRLKQILLNLLTNAIKFTPDGGKVGLEAIRDGDEMIFAVWDTGIGISQEDQKKLFKPFVQIESSLSRSYPGTGLGLSLVKRLVDLHGGRVRLESSPNRGSRFEVAIPTDALSQKETRPESPPDESAASRETAAGAFNILLAEDNPWNVKTIAGFLEAKGFNVLVAEDGYRALDMARSEKPGLILMDIHMPGIDGLEATRRLKADPDTKGIPIIALTAMAMKEDEESCLKAGADGYLSKPVHLDRLLEVIGEKSAVKF